MQQMYTCPNCQAQVVYGQSACGNCGVALDWGQVPQTPPASQDIDSQQVLGQQMYTCPNCQGQVVYGQSACSNCGIALDWGGVQHATGRRKPDKHQRQNTYGKIMAMFKKKRPSGVFISLMALLFVVLVAGGIFWALNGDSLFTSSTKPLDDQPAASTSNGFEKPPAVKSFGAEPSTITQGQEAKLSWDVSEATSVTIDPGIGTVSLSGIQVVSPEVTTTYHLTAANNAGPVSASVVVTVKEPPEPAITSFSASKNSISAGESVTLQWKVARASYVNIDQGIGIVISSGERRVTPTKTTTYTINATNAVGSATASVTVTVAAAGVPVINSFTVNPDIIAVSDNSTLGWDVSGATSVSIDQGIGSVLATGTTIVSPAETTTYTITARNNAGTVTASAKVTVASELPEITSFTVSKSSISAEESVTLQWNITGATSASIDPGVGVVSGTSTTVSPTVTTTYTLTATNSHGSNTETVTVTVP